jgi:hypothetical protein
MRFAASQPLWLSRNRNPFDLQLIDSPILKEAAERGDDPAWSQKRETASEKNAVELPQPGNGE